MVKYISYDRVETEHTVLEFRGGAEDVLITSFTGEDINSNIISISSTDETKIDELIASQPAEINCIELSKDDFKLLVKNSDQLKRIRTQVKEKIALKYDLADEAALARQEFAGILSAEKKQAYQDYVIECLEFGNKLKEEIGY